MPHRRDTHQQSPPIQTNCELALFENPARRPLITGQLFEVRGQRRVIRSILQVYGDTEDSYRLASLKARRRSVGMKTSCRTQRTEIEGCLRSSEYDWCIPVLNFVGLQNMGMLVGAENLYLPDCHCGALATEVVRHKASHPGAFVGNGQSKQGIMRSPLDGLSACGRGSFHSWVTQ